MSSRVLHNNLKSQRVAPNLRLYMAAKYGGTSGYFTTITCLTMGYVGLANASLVMTRSSACLWN
jgi:hypothetical protein